jgi:serine/threonine protein kinase
VRAFLIIHRSLSYNEISDLKPENILLDATGHVALCDFGLSKPDLGSDELTNTFCGTTEYLAPEVLLDEHGYSKLVDFWSLGVLLFEMCCGWSPFYAEDTQQMYKNICFGKIRFPRGVINEDGKQFVKGVSLLRYFIFLVRVLCTNVCRTSFSIVTRSTDLVLSGMPRSSRNIPFSNQ